MEKKMFGNEETYNKCLNTDIKNYSKLTKVNMYCIEYSGCQKKIVKLHISSLL